MAAGCLPDVFSVIQPSSATYCTPRASGAIIGRWSASILPSARSSQHSPKGNPLQIIFPGFTARYGHNARGKEAALATVHFAQP